MRVYKRLRAIPDRWLDPALAAGFLIAWEIEITTMSHRHGPLVLNVLAVALGTGALAWRRRSPLAVACFVMGLGVVMTATLTFVDTTVASTFALFIPAYTVAAYEAGPRAGIGLAVCLASVVTVATISGPSFGNYAFPVGMVGASWVTGRALRSRRLLERELTRKTERIATERESRTRLAVADERTRIARELHAVVANSVAAMVVQTTAAQRLLDEDSDCADAAMAAVEKTGRQALGEMRRILGVLRRASDDAELTPQPGVGQMPALVERTRAAQRQVELEVEGEPGPLPASVDLGVYRILEEALRTGREHVDEPTAVVLRFGERDVELEVTSCDRSSLAWPTLAMRERVALCEGAVEVEPAAGAGTRLQVRIPRVFDEVFV